MLTLTVYWPVTLLVMAVLVLAGVWGTASPWLRAILFGLAAILLASLAYIQVLMRL